MWKIDHATDSADGTVNVCRLVLHDTDDSGKPRQRLYQLQTAVRIPRPGPGDRRVSEDAQDPSNIDGRSRPIRYRACPERGR